MHNYCNENYNKVTFNYKYILFINFVICYLSKIDLLKMNKFVLHNEK